MKKMFSLSAALLTACLAFAQSADLSHFIQEHKTDKGMTFAYLSKDLFEVVSKSDIKDQDWKKVQNVVKNIGSLTILTGDSLDNSLSLYKEAARLVTTPDFDEILSVRDGNDHVRLWTRDDDQSVTDLVLLVGSTDEFVLINFSGNLELSNITDLISLFDADEAEQLAKTTAAVSVDFGINPNPSTGQITITSTDGKDLPAMLTVTDQNGRQVKSLQLNATTTQQINLGDLPAGLYWVQLRTEKGNIGVKQLQMVHEP